jgi:DNA-directed RNA polymerase subunit H (RpoH/RPB5)
MSESLNTVIYTTKEQKEIVLNNCLKMIERRNIKLDKDNIFKTLKDELSDNKALNFTDKNNNNYQFIILFLKISNISQLEEVLNVNVNKYKFVFLQSVTKKVFQQITSTYDNVEVFFIDELLEDIPSKVFIPKHTLLNDSDKTELLNNFKSSELAKIYEYDIMSRYYNAKPDDIFRIERFNLNSCTSIYYRVIIKSPVDIIFNKY